MKSKEYYISLILSHAEELRKNFGVKSLRLFGSVSRDEQKEGSDVDVCVDMEPKMFLVVRLKRFLENLLQCSVDVIRMHKHINPYLLKEIEHDGIYLSFMGTGMANQPDDTSYRIFHERLESQEGESFL